MVISLLLLVYIFTKSSWGESGSERWENEGCWLGWAGLGWAGWPGAKMPIISTVIKTATVSLLCQNSLTVGAGRLSIWQNTSSHPGQWCLLKIFPQNCQLLIVCSQWTSFGNISALSQLVACCAELCTKYFVPNVWGCDITLNMEFKTNRHKNHQYQYQWLQ